VSGGLRRRVLLVATDRQVSAGVEDDFHHFSLRLEHDGARVTALHGEALRHPWATCPGAGARLQQLVGCPIARLPQAGTAHIDPHQHCTHQYDLALMAMAQAVRGGRRDYLAWVADEHGGRRVASLQRDGVVCLEWTLEASTIEAGSALIGANLRKLDMAALATADPDLAEAVGLLRRAVMVAGGRGIVTDSIAHIEAFAGHMTGACYAFQPERLADGERNKGSVRDFSASAAPLLGGLA
jgi:hypothetical protein